jgi:hypothetical protein
MFRRQISEEITSTISTAWYFTTKSGGIWKKQLIQHHLVLLEELARGQKQEYHIRILARGKSA